MPGKIDVEKRAIAVVAKIAMLDEADIDTKSTFEELGIDSLSRIEILVDLEREFDLQLGGDEEEQENLLADVHAVDDVVRLIIEAL